MVDDLWQGVLDSLSEYLVRNLSSHKLLTIVCSEEANRAIDSCILGLAVKKNSHILISFGIQVKFFRRQKGLSQEALAHRASLHRTYIGMIERAEKNITLLNIEKIADALEVSISQLCDNSDG